MKTDKIKIFKEKVTRTHRVVNSDWFASRFLFCYDDQINKKK